MLKEWHGRRLNESYKRGHRDGTAAVFLADRLTHKITEGRPSKKRRIWQGIQETKQRIKVQNKRNAKTLEFGRIIKWGKPWHATS